MYGNDWKALEGEKVTSIVSTDTLVTLALASGKTAAIRLEGDCCSSNYFTSPAEQFGELVGATIQSAEERDGSSRDGMPASENGDEVSWHFLVFVTERGHTTIDWRNDSNGYYDGSVYLTIDPPPAAEPTPPSLRPSAGGHTVGEIDEATLALLREPKVPPAEPGLCGCGCGERTTRYANTDKKRGRLRGEFARFVYGHRQRLPSSDKPISLAGNFDVRDRGFSSPCWIWNRYINQNGYGLWRVGHFSTGAHRVVYERIRGPIPAGLHLDHLCRVPACVNPDHLEPVTVAVNVQRGAHARLSPEKVREIRSSRMSAAALARKFGVGETTVRDVRKGLKWKNIAETIKNARAAVAAAKGETP